MANIPLKSIKFPNLPDTYVIPDPDTTLAVSGAAADSKAVGDALATKAGATETTAALAEKANIDGSYEGMTAGNAEQLISSVGINDKVPYNFRTTGGSADVGDRKTEKIIGGTIAWNQKIKNGNFESTSDWSASAATISAANNILTVTKNTNTGQGVGYARQTSLSFVVGHKYFMTVDYKGIAGKTLTLFSNSATAGMRSVSPQDTNWHTLSQIVHVTGVPSVPGILWLNYETTTDDNVAQFKNYNIIDLTLMFGSAIADYLYALETATPGAGVAKFRQLFPKPYYAYNAGDLLSVKVSKAISVGFNAYDNSTGKAKLVGGNVYQITGTYTALSFNGETITPDSNGKFTPSGNGELTVTGGNATDTCVHLVWDGERDGEYEEYKTYEYALDSDLELRGVWKLDSNNDIYCDGDEYESDGTVTRKYRDVLIDGGTNGIAFVNSFGATNNGFAVYINAGLGNRSSKVISDKFVYSDAGYSSMPLFSFVGGSGAITTWVFILPSTVTSTAEANAWAAQNPFHIIIPLETPTTEEADPYQNPMIVDDFGTEEFVDSREVAIPVGHDTFYQANLKAKLEMAPNSPDGDGDYIVRQTNGTNEYTDIANNSTIAGLVSRVPEAPSEDGTYTLKATVSNGTKTYSWVADE